MSKLAVVIPVYNEEGSIAVVIADWVKVLDQLQIDYRLCAYNDGSKDRTHKILDELTNKYPKLHAIHKVNSGHGPTILKGYKENLDCEWLFQVDSDNEMKAEHFSKLWEQRDNYDFLIGKRINRQSPLPRKIISYISYLSVRLIYGPGIQDVNAPYRLMRVSLFKELIAKIPDDTFAPNVIMSGLACMKKARIFTHPVPFEFRTTGTVSIKKWKLLKAAMKSFWQTIKFRF